MQDIDNASDIEGALIASNIVQATSNVQARISDAVRDIHINPRSIFCQKTGAVIGIRDENSMKLAMKIRGQKAFEEMLYSSPSLAVHPAWIKTDSEALDDLQELDAQGYAVFCLGLMTARFYQNTHAGNPVLFTPAERHWALARAWQILRKEDAYKLRELNANLCRFLTYNSEASGYLVKVLGKHAKQPDKLALLAVAGELIPILHRVIEDALDSLGRADYFIKRDKLKETAATVQGVAAKAPSHIRGQKQSKRDVQMASEIRKLDAVFGDIFKATVPGTGAWIKRMAAEQNARLEAEYMDAKHLDALGDIFGEDLGEDDGAVEVRTVPLSELEETVAASPIALKIVAAKPAPALPSIMEQLKAVRRAVHAATPGQIAPATPKPNAPLTTPGLSMMDQLRALRGSK